MDVGGWLRSLGLGQSRQQALRIDEAVPSTSTPRERLDSHREASADFCNTIRQQRTFDTPSLISG
jgi:hypothetical protein